MISMRTPFDFLVMVTVLLIWQFHTLHQLTWSTSQQYKIMGRGVTFFFSLLFLFLIQKNVQSKMNMCLSWSHKVMPLSRLQDIWIFCTTGFTIKPMSHHEWQRYEFHKIHTSMYCSSNPSLCEKTNKLYLPLEFFQVKVFFTHYNMQQFSHGAGIQFDMNAEGNYTLNPYLKRVERKYQQNIT